MAFIKHEYIDTDYHGSRAIDLVIATGDVSSINPEDKDGLIRFVNISGEENLMVLSRNSERWISLVNERGPFSFSQLSLGLASGTIEDPLLFEVGNNATLIYAGDGIVNANRFFGDAIIPTTRGGTGKASFITGHIPYSVDGQLDSSFLLQYNPESFSLIVGHNQENFMGSGVITLSHEAFGPRPFIHFLTPTGLIASPVKNSIEVTVTGIYYTTENGDRAKILTSLDSFDSLPSVVTINKGGTNTSSYGTNSDGRPLYLSADGTFIAALNTILTGSGGLMQIRRNGIPTIIDPGPTTVNTSGRVLMYDGLNFALSPNALFQSRKNFSFSSTGIVSFTHNMGVYPQVMVLNSGLIEVKDIVVAHNSLNSVTITHTGDLTDAFAFFDVTSTSVDGIGPPGPSGADGLPGLNGNPYEIFRVLQSNETGAGTNTDQPWFPSSGSVNLQANSTYLFSGTLQTSQISIPSHNLLVGFGGDVGINSIAYSRRGAKSTVNGTQTAQFLSFRNNNSMAIATATNTTTGGHVVVWGVIKTSTSGSLIPQFRLSAVSGTTVCTIQAGTHFGMTKIGDNNADLIGDWS